MARKLLQLQTSSRVRGNITVELMFEGKFLGTSDQTLTLFSDEDTRIATTDLGKHEYESRH